MTDFHKKSIQSLLSEKRLAEAFADPQREEIHNGITAKLMELADIT